MHWWPCVCAYVCVLGGAHCSDTNDNLQGKPQLSSWLTRATRLTPSSLLTWHFNTRELWKQKAKKIDSKVHTHNGKAVKGSDWAYSKIMYVYCIVQNSWMYFCTSSSSKLVRSHICFRHICRLFQCSRKQAATRRHTEEIFKYCIPKIIGFKKIKNKHWPLVWPHRKMQEYMYIYSTFTCRAAWCWYLCTYIYEHTVSLTPFMHTLPVTPPVSV